MIFISRYIVAYRFFSLLLAVCAGNSFAQSVSQNELQICSSQETAELKLACFEALTVIAGKTAQSTEPAEADTPDEPSVPAPTRATQELSAIETVQSAPGAPAEQTATNRVEAEVASSGATTEVAGQAAVADAAQSAPAAEFGDEHVGKASGDTNKQTEISATVVEVTEGRHKVLYFQLANGHVWRQIEGRRYRYPRDGEFDVIISRGMLGDYRLRIDEDGPMTRIRRIQ